MTVFGDRRLNVDSEMDWSVHVAAAGLRHSRAPPGEIFLERSRACLGERAQLSHGHAFRDQHVSLHVAFYQSECAIVRTVSKVGF